MRATAAQPAPGSLLLSGAVLSIAVVAPAGFASLIGVVASDTEAMAAS